MKHKFRHFLEIFNPNAPQNLPAEAMPFYVNDMIMRVLAGMSKAERPLFLKMPFNGRKAMEELASHDPGLVIGILGGSSGTTRDCFELLAQGEKSGAKVALFGRKINLAESPLDLVALFRPVIESEVTAEQAVKHYHAILVEEGPEAQAQARGRSQDHRTGARGLQEVTRRGIVLAGIVVLDIVHIIDHWPAEETLAFIDRTEMAAGGPPHNAAAGLLKLGADFPVTLLATAGSDAYGATMLASARGYGLDTSRVTVIPGAITSHTHVMSCQDTGRRTFFAQLGCNNLMHGRAPDAAGGQHRQDLLSRQPRHGPRPRPDRWLAHAAEGGEGPRHEDLPRALPGSRRRPAQAGAALPAARATCSWSTTTRPRASPASTSRPRVRLSWAAAEEACRKLLAMGVGELACVHHPDGAVAVTRNGEVAKRPSVRVDQSEIAGSTGAGDAFYAGVLLRPARGLAAAALPRPRQRRRRHVAPLAHHQRRHPSVGGMPRLCQGKGPAVDLGQSPAFTLPRLDRGILCGGRSKDARV